VLQATGTTHPRPTARMTSALFTRPMLALRAVSRGVFVTSLACAEDPF
jgi:hypothetical protein